MNDGTAELEPINTHHMTISAPLTRHTNTHTHTHWSVTMFICEWQRRVTKVERACTHQCLWVRMCVLHTRCHDQLLLERWKADFLVTLCAVPCSIVLVHVCAGGVAASVACCLCAQYIRTICAFSWEHIGICFVGVSTSVCVSAYKCGSIFFFHSQPAYMNVPAFYPQDFPSLKTSEHNPADWRYIFHIYWQCD